MSCAEFQNFCGAYVKFCVTTSVDTSVEASMIVVETLGATHVQVLRIPLYSLCEKCVDNLLKGYAIAFLQEFRLKFLQKLVKILADHRSVVSRVQFRFMLNLDQTHAESGSEYCMAWLRFKQNLH